MLCTTKLGIKHFPVPLCTTKLAQSTSQYYFVLQSLPKALPSTTLYKALPSTTCTAKLAQSTSQYYLVLHKALPSTTLYYKACTKHVPVLLLVLQSLHKALPSTTLYYKACLKHFPVLLLALQSLHKALPSTTVYYKACKKHFPVLLCTTKLARSTSQYYFVPQSLHEALPSTTLYYKACTKHFPVLLLVLQSLHKALPSTTTTCATTLTQSTSQYYSVFASFVVQSSTGKCFVQALWYKVVLGSASCKLCSTE